MKDRVPASGKEGRVKLTFEDGTVQYAVVEMADDPSEAGTPLNKASLLKDPTAALFGLGTDAVPDDALNAIGSRQPPMSAYGSDLFLYTMGMHPVLNAGPYDDLPAIRAQYFGVTTA